MDLDSFLTFELVRGSEDSSPSDQLTFSVEVTEIRNDDLHFKIMFDNPLSISSGSSKDIMIITSQDEAFFSSMSSGRFIRVGTA